MAVFISRNTRVFFILMIILVAGLQVMIHRIKTSEQIVLVQSRTKANTNEDYYEEHVSSCNETFNTTFEDNLQVIQNYPIGNADVYVRRFGAYNDGPKEIRAFPVFVTAFDETHYNESQGLFKSIHETFLVSPKYKDKLLILVYDLGMTPSQIRTVENNCKCEVRQFIFQQFPQHVNVLQTYAFKPLIVQEVLMEFGFVWWMDTSIRFRTNDIDSVIENAKKYSYLFTVSLNYLAVGTLTKHTFKATFDFLREDRCKFKRFHEIWATTLLFHFDRITSIVVRAWVKCALNELCIAPEGSLHKRGCNFQHDYDGRCHRFDQSVLGIITRRIINEYDYPTARTLPPNIYNIERRNIVPYFE
ncbi:uncharacterized protein LOC123566048 isoform X2 [Mercenaria mercenaria]|uniref:uncharacterized protein LOC123566048 isoform X2 n=1 Tax=Mercenaria mercenaria TaxID=6596 RepID=UPI00234FA327|nr:uncharacterized protein LOC123566048 isoform X2 [Mercenaria mercenaria]